MRKILIAHELSKREKNVLYAEITKVPCNIVSLTQF